MFRPPLRIFISSPGDVGLEREICSRVIERLQGKFGAHFELQPVRWENQAVRATSTFQPQIVPPSQTDIVVCVLWSRLGTPLPEEFQRPDGSRYGSGTEWEFEEALRAHQEHGTPDLLVYRRTQAPLISIHDDKQYAERRTQYQALEAFVHKWFFNEDGTFKAAFKGYETVDAFERLLEADLQQLLLERLSRQAGTRPGLEPPPPHWPGSPFRGLNAFELEHAKVFCGRTRAIGDICEGLVRRADAGCPFLLIFGMSGCGKSSLARAGVLATLTRPGVVEGAGLWRRCQFRPSDAAANLCQGLAAAIVADGALAELRTAGVDAAQLGTMLAEAPQHVAVPLGMALRRAAEDGAGQSPPPEPGTPRLIVVVDQLEELFTLAAVTDEQRRQFVRALGALARGGVWVLATMRSDFYHRCAELSELAALKEGAGQYDLLPPTFDEIDQMITYPARAAGLCFERDPRTE